MKQYINNKHELKQLSYEARFWLKKAITKEHPEWVDNNGNCGKRDKYYSSLSNLKDSIKEIYL